MSELTLAALIRSHAEADPAKPMVTFGDVHVTRAELVERATKVASYMHANGVKEGDYVSIVLANCVEHVIASIACWFAGATPQPLSPKSVPEELAAIMELTGPAAVVGLDESQIPAGAIAIPASLDVPEVDVELPDDLISPAWKAPTSGGSTGRPKVIVATQPATWEAVGGFATVFGLSGSTTLITAPLSHNGPFIITLLTVASGGHVVLMGRFDAQTALDLVEKYQITWIYAVPTMMGRILRLPEEVRKAADVSSVQTLFHMAAPCPPQVKQAFIEWFPGDIVKELYAGTEAQAVSVITGSQWLTHRGSVGLVLMGEMEIRDDDGNALPPGESGRIWMRSGGAETYRYLGATATTSEDGWETLGDLGYFDEDGFLYLNDRDTDMILVGGSNVYPAEIEAALLSHPAVSDACVIGLPHEDLGAAPHALVLTTSPVSEDELRAHLAGALSSYKQPKSYEFVDEPLRDDAGKVRRSALRAARLNEARSL